jgi:hypothetical protein
VDHFFPPLFHLRALSAKLARLRVFWFLDFFIERSLETGILLPFFTPAAFRSLPRLDFLMLMPDLRFAVGITSLRR